MLGIMLLCCGYNCFVRDIAVVLLYNKSNPQSKASRNLTSVKQIFFSKVLQKFLFIRCDFTQKYFIKVGENRIAIAATSNISEVK